MTLALLFQEPLYSLWERTGIVLMLLHPVSMTLIFTSLCYRIHLQMIEEQDLQSCKSTCPSLHSWHKRKSSEKQTAEQCKLYDALLKGLHMCAYTEKEGKECSFTIWMLSEGLHNPKEGKTIKLLLKLKRKTNQESWNYSLATRESRVEQWFSS